MKELIFEELSISEEVVGYSNIIIQKIEESIDDNDWKKRVLNDSFQFEQNLYLNEIDFLNINLINVKLYNFSTTDEVNEHFKALNFGGEFFPNSTLIIFILPCINGVLDKNFSTGVIQHEIEHVYQTFKSGKTLKNKWLQKSFEGENNKNEIIRNFSELFYYFSKMEIDANANALFSNLNQIKAKNMGDVEKTQTVYDYKLHLNLYSNVMTEKNLEIGASYYKISSKQIYNFLTNQNKYLKVKFGKVIQNYFNNVIPESVLNSYGMKKIFVNE